MEKVNRRAFCGAVASVSIFPKLSKAEFPSEIRSVTLMTGYNGKDVTKYWFKFDGGEEIELEIKRSIPVVHNFYDKLYTLSPPETLVSILEHFQPVSLTMVNLRTNFGSRTK